MLIKKWPYLCVLIAGAFYATGFPMFGGHTFILGPFFAFLLLNWCLEQSNDLKTQLIYGWLYSLGFYLTGYYWIPGLLKEFGAIPAPFNYGLGILFSFILLPQIYIFVLFKRRYSNIILVSTFYTLFEYFTPQQFPSHLGHTFISLVPKFNLNLAPIFGASIYSFIVCLVSLSILKHIKLKSISKLYYGLALILILISFYPANKNSNFDSVLKIRLVQPNIGNFIKVDSERGGSNSMKNVFDSYYELSAPENVQAVDLIIWPETAFPNIISSEISQKNGPISTPALINKIIEKTQSEMFIGGYDINLKSKFNYGFESDFNTAFYFSKNSELKDVYHKMKLIPFGEGLPFGPFNKFLSKYITNVSFFAKGEHPTLFTLPNGDKFSSAICYEILFPAFIRDLLNGNAEQEESSFIINLTNDSWYGDTFEPYQHLFLTKWRSLEFNIPIIRSTNTGITAIIYPDGLESKRMMINEKKYMDLEFKYSKRSKTIFQKYGILIFIIFSFSLSFLEKSLLLRARVSE